MIEIGALGFLPPPYSRRGVEPETPGSGVGSRGSNNRKSDPDLPVHPFPPLTSDDVVDVRDLSKELPEKRNFTKREAIHELIFWIFPFSMMCTALSGLLVVSSYKTFGQDSGFSDNFLTNVGAVSSVMNAAGRIAWGVVADYVPFYYTIPIMAMSSCLFMTLYYTLTQLSQGLYFFVTCAIYGCFAGNFSLYPAAVLDVFGSEHGSVIYGFFFALGYVPAGVLAALLPQQLLDLLGYLGLFILLGGIALISIPFVIIIRYRMSKLKEMEGLAERLIADESSPDHQSS